jgi:hypothetical protein
MTASTALRALFLAGSVAALAAPAGECQAALTDEEIRRQIEQATERGREPKQTAQPAGKVPETPRAAPVPGEEFNPAIKSHDDFTAFHFPGELGNAQTYEVAHADDAIWVGTSIGLVRHDPRANRWSLIRVPKETGAEGVPSVVAAGRRLAVKLWHYPSPGHADSKGAWWYDISSGAWERIGNNDFLEPLQWDGHRLWSRIGDRIYQYDPATRDNRELSDKQQPVPRHIGVNDVVVSGYEAWVCTYGKHNPKTRRFDGGGIQMLHLQSGMWRYYTASGSGPAHDYCAAIVADVDSIWVAHWDNDKGLSRYDRKGYRWEHLPVARNRTAIGGVRLALDRDRLWIGQQNGITWLDLASRNAYSFKESMGLPGYITSGFALAPGAVWAGMHALGGKNFHGVRSSGLVRLPRPAPQGSATGSP